MACPLHHRARGDDRIADALDDGDTARAQRGAVHDGRVHLDLALGDQARAAAGVEKRRVNEHDHSRDPRVECVLLRVARLERLLEHGELLPSRLVRAPHAGAAMHDDHHQTLRESYTLSGLLLFFRAGLCLLANLLPDLLLAPAVTQVAVGVSTHKGLLSWSMYRFVAELDAHRKVIRAELAQALEAQ